MGISLWSIVKFSEKSLKLLDENIFLDRLLKGNVITGATMAFKQYLKKDILPIPNTYIHDYWIGLIATINGSVIAIPEKLILYRQHENNIIGVIEKSLLKRFKIYLKNYGGIHEIRESRLKGIDKLLKKSCGMKQNEMHKQILMCHDFWFSQSQLEKRGVFNGIKIISRDILKGNYCKYYNGLRSIVRDLICLLIHRNNI